MVPEEVVDHKDEFAVEMACSTSAELSYQQSNLSKLLPPEGGSSLLAIKDCVEQQAKSPM